MAITPQLFIPGPAAGPSRTSDIERTLTLGVHGPKSLSAWRMDGP